MSEKDSILNRINYPSDLKALDEKELEPLCSDIREFLIENVSKTGGHLASNLGVVELSVALHRVFSTPKDHIIWDVGHQSYVHKILTGRRERFDTLRRPGGLSGFTKRSESEHDCFGTGHSSTSISAALGIAEADRINGETDRYTVAVIGDGAFTGGMAHEALNNCDPRLKLIIVINENEMSISKNIGQFAQNLANLRATRTYRSTKRITKKILRHIPLIGKPIYKCFMLIKKLIKNIVYKSNYFEDMGLYYIGPVDGNDVCALEKALRSAREQGENVVVHIKTKKGKGFEPSELDPGKYHSMPSANNVFSDKETFSEAFGRKLTELAQRDEKICAITAAMCDGTGLCSFREKNPDRFFDVGIAEEHALTFAAGLAAEGTRPVAAIYSTFLQRGYDNIIHDIALQDLPVTICIDRAGLNPSDGATHHGIFDVAFLSGVPGMTIYAPASLKSLEAVLEEALYSGHPAAIRYPSGTENEEIVNAFFANEDFSNIGVPKCDSEPYDDPDLVIITYGRIAAEALKVKKALYEAGKRCNVVLLEKLKPYGETANEISKYLPTESGVLIFLEEEIRAGGMGMLLSDELCRRGLLDGIKYSILASDDSFVIPDKDEHIYETAGVSARDILLEYVNMIK